MRSIAGQKPTDFGAFQSSILSSQSQRPWPSRSAGFRFFSRSIIIYFCCIWFFSLDYFPALWRLCFVVWFSLPRTHWVAHNRQCGLQWQLTEETYYEFTYHNCRLYFACSLSYLISCVGWNYDIPCLMDALKPV